MSPHVSRETQVRKSSSSPPKVANSRPGVAIFDARMQDILIDALKYREAMAGIAERPAKPIPQVQKPGNGTSKAERSAAQVGDLRRAMQDASGNKQIEAAVRYIQAKRASRG